MRRSLETPIPDSPLPAGMRIHDCVDADIGERSAVHMDAWSHLAHLGMPEARSSFSVEVYEGVRGGALYRADLDLVAEASDGRYASCLLAWVDEENGVGLIEPVGTRDAYRRQGLSRAVNLEALRRFRDLGLHSAHIQTTNFNKGAEATYLSCGFDIIEGDHYYVKRLD